MINRQTNNLKKTNVDLVEFFEKPLSSRQKQYELIRAITIENMPIEKASNKFGYKVATTYSLIRDVKAGKLNLFPEIKKGPRKRRTSIDVQDKIIEYRNSNLSTPDIEKKLAEDNIKISSRTIERILKDAGYGKLKRRTFLELGKTSKNKLIPERSEILDFSRISPFSVDCPAAGVFFFIPYILESGILDIIQKCELPDSKDISSLQASLSMLLLKLIGCERLTHIDRFDQEPGLGVFAGLNILPKPTYMNTYSCRCSEKNLMEFQSEIVECLRNKYPEFYSSDYINLDFHSIPHFGDKSEMEKVWCGARNKTMKGANTVFVQDSQSNVILYTRADILRAEESQEVKKFIEYWESIRGGIKETLVFDCKFTTYEVLDEISKKDVKFITLRKRNIKIITEVLEISEKEWNKIYLPIPKRKYKYVSVIEKEVNLGKSKRTYRQIVIKDHGRTKPTFIITNNSELTIKEIVTVYAKRWRIENKISELVAFFNLNALSSPVMIRIHFDIIWTIVADTLYHRLASDLRRFEKNLSPTIFRKFIDMPGRLIYDGEKFIIKIRKRAHTPVLKEVEKLNKPIFVPWLSGKSVEIVWTA
jgi:transposase